MYGNKTLPGIEASDTLRYEGSIWRGPTESTWFKHAKFSGAGEEPVNIQAGTIVKEDSATGYYAPIAEGDIASLSGKLAIVADYTAKSGSTTDGEISLSNVLVGVCGQVDKAKLYVGEKLFTDLTDEQKISLNSKLEASGFLLVNVIQG